jgi:hypothetical protein
MTYNILFAFLGVLTFSLGVYAGIILFPHPITSVISNDSRISMCLGKYMGEIHIIWNSTSRVYDTQCVSNPGDGSRLLFSFGVVSP